MAGYIEREAAKEAVVKAVGKGHSPFNAIVMLPAADVRPVVRGEWKPIDLTYGRSYYFCSACEETVDMPTAMGIPMFRYCPNCGAKMESK